MYRHAMMCCQMSGPDLNMVWTYCTRSSRELSKGSSVEDVKDVMTDQSWGNLIGG